MIVLDTNVVSELMRPRPEAIVIRWVDDQPADEVCVTAITAAELLYGVARLPAGPKRDAVAARVERLLSEKFDRRVLPFDLAASRAHGSLLAACERQGRPMPASDAQIASICLARRMSLATRNGKDFDRSGVPLINPWEQP